MMTKLLFVALGGSVGAVIRYLLSLWALERFGAGFPWGTLIVNLTGCLLIGVLSVVVGGTPHQEHLKPLLITGLLGALTTFSTFSFESTAALESGKLALPIANVFGSCFFGIILVFAGLKLGRLILEILGQATPGV